MPKRLISLKPSSRPKTVPDTWDAQFKTVADFAEFLSTQLDVAMSTTDKFVPWPVFPDNATREDVMAAWVIADRELKRLKGFDLSQ